MYVVRERFNFRDVFKVSRGPIYLIYQLHNCDGYHRHILVQSELFIMLRAASSSK